MKEAFNYDALRTPRGNGRPDGRLHEVNPVDLLAGLMQALQRRPDKIYGYRVFILHGSRSWLRDRLGWQKTSGKLVIFGIGGGVRHL
jgi:hypothetical protein